MHRREFNMDFSDCRSELLLQPEEFSVSEQVQQLIL